MSGSSSVSDSRPDQSGSSSVSDSRPDQSGSSSVSDSRPTPRPDARFIEVWQRSTGAEFIQAMAGGGLPAAPHFAHLGLEIVKAEPGAVELSWVPGAQLCNPGGIVHGGYISIPLDDAGGLSCASTGERFTPMLTMDLRIEYFRPVLAEVRHVVLGRVVHSGRTRSVADARVEDPDGRLVARGSGAFTPNRAYRAARDARAEGAA